MDCEASATREDLEFILLNEDAEPKPLPLSLLVDITSDFSDENIIGSGGFARVYKGSIRNRTVAVKRLQPVLHFDENGFHREIKCLMKVKHQNVVRFLGYCNETRGKMAGFNGTLVMAQEQERLLCFQYLSKGGLDNYITDASSGLEWEQRYRIINGVCQGLHQLHEDNILHMDLKPQNILLGDDMVPKIADFGLSRRLHEDQSYVITKNLCGTHGYMAPEFIDSNPENRAITKKCDLYSLGVIIMELLTGTRKQCAVNDVLDTWISRLGESKTKAQLEQIKECAQIAIECSNPRAENRPPDTKHIIDRLEKVGTQQSTGKLLLQAHPTFLVFELQPAGKLSPCLLDLTNDTDERMMFKLRTAESRGESREFYSDSSMEESVHRCWPEQFLPRHGIVAARSTYTLILTVSWEREIPEKRFCDMILESWPERNSNSEAKEEVKLTAYLSTQHRQSTIPTATGQLGVTISWMEKPRTELYSVDAHPTKPWIITGHERGRVTIRNHDTQKLLYSFIVSRGPVHSVKFIARKQWFICATADEGLAHVYSYETQEIQKINSFRVAEGLAHVYSYETQEMQKINSFRVCDDDYHICLAVHPSLAYVMSWCIFQPFMKLWDWDNGWECTRTFQIIYKTVTQVAFDPKETNRFAAAIGFHPSNAGDVTIWSLDCPEPEYHLPLTDLKVISFLEFFTRDDQQYLIIANKYREAHVWDLQQRKFVFKKRKSLSLEPSVFSHPNLPLVITPSRNGTCCFWSAKDISHYYGVLDNSNGGDVHCIACLMGSKTRFVIGQSYALIVLDIQKATFQEDLQESTETKLCDVTRHAYTSSELITQGSSEIHHIHPLKADFSFEDDDLIPCLLHLTNKTDKHTAFMLSSTTEEQPFEATPLNHGIVPSRSIYTLDYKMPKGEKKSNLILQSSIYRERYIYTFEDQSECDQFFEDAKETRNVVHEVVLEPVLSQKGETASENRSTGQDVTQRLIQIRGLCDPTMDNDVISSLDVNPAQSWIMTFHQNGNFFIRDIDTQEKIYLMSTKDDVYSVKIITRKQWVLVGTRDGFIHVYEYETGMTRIKRFKVGEPYSSYTDKSGVLVVHPTLPYVLSTNGYKMKLWDWDKGWECIQTFENEAYMGQVAFSPEGTNTFATASSNHKIKLWSHSSPTAEYTLHGHEGRVNCLDFFRGDDVNQYLISGSEDCMTKIWDLQKKTCLHTLGVFLSPVTSVISLPDSPYMVTGSRDGTVHLWSSPSLRLERVLQIGCARPVRNLYLMGSKRVVIQKMNEISIMDIDASSKEPPELLLHVHPTTLVFELQPGKLSQCSLQLTNDTDQEMKFKLSSTESVDWSEQFLPRKGIVAARSTYTLILNVFLERDIAERRFCDMILKSCKFAERRYWDKLFDYQKTNNNVANEVKLRACLSSSQHRQSIVAPMPTGLGVRVSWMEKPRTRLLSVDAHPIRPWIITGHECGGVAIRNHDTQRLLCSSKVSRRGVYSVKFIWQKQWFICSSGEGFIHVYSYETQEIQKVNCFRAYDDNSRWLPISLAVHPSRPYVMSWCRYDREIMNLWDWDKGWECIRTFRSGGGYVVDHVAFDPMETNRFVATDWLDGKVTIWSLDSPEPEYHLPKTDFKGVMFLEFFTRYGRQYLIIADGDHKARVWDFRLREFVSRKRKLLSREASVFSRPNVPLLLTPSSRGTCRFWDAKKFSFYGVLDNSAGGDVQGIACLMGSKTRFVIGQYYALTILHLDNATYQKDPRQSIEPQLCAHTGQGDTSSEEKYGEEMVWRHGPDFDWHHEPFDGAIMRANVGEKAHGRYMLSDIMIDSTEVTAQRMSSLFCSLSLSSHQPNKQELEVARLCEELRQRDEHQKVQQDYFFSFIQQQHAIIQALSHQHGLDVVLPEFRLPLPPMLPQLSPFLSTLSQATSDASGTEPTGMAFVESFAYPPLGTDSEHNSNHPSSGFGA